MSQPARLVMFGVAASLVGALVVLAVLEMPAFGRRSHPYRTAAVHAAVRHATANVVSSVNFDQRGFDTLGEESILLASVMGVSALLRPAEDEEEQEQLSPGRVLDVVTLAGYVVLPVAILIGLDVVAHGHLTPGGGFQGGVVVGSGLHVAYVAGRYRTLRKIDPELVFEWGEAFGAAAFACLGVSAVVVGGAFLANVLPFGAFGQLFSSGTVGLLNGVVGIEVASGTMVLLAKFLEQAILVKRQEGGAGDGSLRGSGG